MTLDQRKTAAEDALHDLMRAPGNPEEKANAMIEIAEQASHNAISLKRRVKAERAHDVRGAH